MDASRWAQKAYDQLPELPKVLQTQAKTRSLTIAFIGTGRLLTSIIKGLLASSEADNLTILATVQHKSSIRRVLNDLGRPDHIATEASSLQVYKYRYNAHCIVNADLTVLGVHPSDFESILHAGGIVNALQGKVLASVLGGVSSDKLDDAIRKSHNCTDEYHQDPAVILRTMTSTAASVREAFTLIEDVATEPPNSYFPQPSKERRHDAMDLATRMFSLLGRTRLVPASEIDASSAISGSGPAFFARLIRPAADALVEQGVAESLALEMVAEAMIGTGALVRAGKRPEEVVESVTSPQGSTARGLQMMDELGVAAGMRKAVEITAEAAAKLGNKQ